MAPPIDVPAGTTTGIGTPSDPDVRRTVAAVVIVIMLSVTISLELTLVYPALASLAMAFQTTNITWALSIVTLVGAAICPLAGKLGDAYGKNRVIAVIAVICCLGSLLCAVAPTFLLFVIGRGLQGVGLVMLILAWGYTRDVLPPRYVALGLGGTVAGLGIMSTAGPFLSAWLLALGGYRAIFWFMLAYTGVFLLAFVVIAPAGSTGRVRRRLDVPSALLLGVGVGLLLLGVTEGSGWGWVSVATLLSLLAGAVLIGGAFVRLRRVDEPLVDLRLLFGPELRTTTALLFLGNFVPTGISVALPLMTQTSPQDGIDYGLGLTPLQYALLQMPNGIIATLCGPLGGLLARIRNPRLVARIGMGIMLAAALLLTFLHSHLWELLLVTGFYGVGFGLLFATFPNLVAQAVPAEDMAATSGVVSSVSGLAGSVAAVVAGVVLAGAVLRIDPVTTAPVYTNAGFVTVLLIVVAAALLGFLVSLFMRHGARPADGTAGGPVH